MNLSFLPFIQCLSVDIFIVAFQQLKSKIPVKKIQSSVTSVNGIFHCYLKREPRYQM